MKNNMNEITEKDQEKIFNHLQLQIIEIRKQLPVNNLSEFYFIKITCSDCDKKIGMINMYRCLQCGLWICKKCGEKHFNIDLSKIPRLIK